MCKSVCIMIMTVKGIIKLQEGIGSEWFVNLLVIIHFNPINMTSKIYSVIICYCL